MATCRRKLLPAICAIVLIVAPGVAFSQSEIVLSASLKGIDENGQMTYTATYPFCGQAETAQIRISCGAQLPVNMPSASAVRLELAGAFFYSNQVSETIDVFSVDGEVVISTGFFNDLGSGTQLGSVVVTTKNRWSVVTLVLNEAGIAAFNSVPRRTCLPDVDGVSCFAGYFRFGLALRGPFSQASELEGMSFEEAGNRLVVTPAALAVESATWGRIKALYRN